MIQVFGLNPFTAEKEAKPLNEASLEEIIEFVFLECLPIIPFQVIDAFKTQGKFDIFKNHITNHLIIVIKMRMEFEHHYNRTGNSLMKSLELHENLTQDNRSYKDLQIINDYYDDQYYKAIKPDPKKTAHYKVVNFQEKFYAFTIAHRTKNPIYSSIKKTYANIESYHIKQQKHLDKNLDATTQFLIESKYNFNFLKDMSKHIAKTKNLDVISIKIIAICGLLPNVFSRTDFIEVLLPHSKKCASKINTLSLLSKYIKHKETGISRNTTVNRANKAALSNQFSVDGLLGYELDEYIQSFKQLESENLLEGWLISLFQFVFPLMEMYAYYLVKKVFNLEFDKQCNIYPRIDTKEEAVLEPAEIDIFNMLAPIMYRIKELKFGTKLPINDELIAPEKVATSLLNTSVSSSFFENETLRYCFNAFVASQKIITDTQAQIDRQYFSFIDSDQVVRSFEKARSSIK